MNRDVCHGVHEALKQHEKDSIRSLIYNKYKKVVFVFFENFRKLALDKIHTPIFEGMHQATVNVFSTEGDNKLLKENMYTLSRSQDLSQRLLRHPIKLPTFTVLVTHFVTKQVKISLAINANFKNILI